MTRWSEGYVTDIPYRTGFFNAAVPAHLAFSAVCAGRSPGGALRPAKVLDLGCGMGLGLAITAAGNPAVRFEGADFLPLHIAHARGLADAAELDNVTFHEASFQDLAREAEEGQQDVDVILAHGVLTWVSPEARAAIGEIARKRLRPGGLLYVSYNCLPGWAPFLPLRRLMRLNGPRALGSANPGAALLQALKTDAPVYFETNPGLEQRLAKLLGEGASYLAHEFMNAHWTIFEMGEVAELLAEAKLDFVGSAGVLENFDQLSVPESARGRLARISSPISRETIRDLAGNKQFRRDIYGRGSALLTPLERQALLGEFRFHLAGKPASRLKFATLLGDLDGQEDLVDPIIALAAGGPVDLPQVAALPPFREGDPFRPLQALLLLVDCGLLLPSVSGPAGDPAPARRLNRIIAGRRMQGHPYHNLAAPAAGSGVEAGLPEMLGLSAITEGKGDSAAALAEYLAAATSRLGVPADRRELDRLAEFLLGQLYPIWRTLGIL